MSKLMRQFLKFGVVGALAFAIDYSLLMLLSQALGMDPVLAAAISFVTSLVFNYLASMRFVFTRRDDLARSREFVTFVLLSVVGLAMNELIMWLGVRALGGSPFAVTVTKLAATFLVMVWNFWSRKRWLEADEGK